MTLTDRYLNAVAAQLPRALREDVIAELRDALLSRMEAREAELGRPLTEADEEAVLREMGHPLAVAARYRPGPQHLVGPELYPWWMFGVKVGLAIMVCLVLVGAALQVLLGEIELTRAVGRAFHDLFDAGIMLIGFATIAAFILERQAVKPKFMTDWRVRDLHLFEMASLDTDAFEMRVTGGTGGSGAGSRPARARPRPMSPTARALASATVWVVLLLWWVGAIDIAGIDPQDMSFVWGGVDYGALISETLRWLWIPVIVYAGCRIAFDLFRAGQPGAVRATALGDIAFGAARMVGWIWVWTASPLAATVAVDAAGAMERLRDLVDGDWSTSAVLTLIVIFNMLEAAGAILGGLWRLATGRDRRLG